MSDVLNSCMVLAYDIDDLLRYMCSLDTDIAIIRDKIDKGEYVSEKEIRNIEHRMRLANERRDNIIRRMRILRKREDEKED